MVVEAGSSMRSSREAMGVAMQAGMAEGMGGSKEAGMGTLLGDMQAREASEAFAAPWRRLMH